MDTPLVFTARELNEIQHALYYTQYLNHGTIGHNVLIILAKFAKDKGFQLTAGTPFEVPPNVIIEG